MKGIEVRSHLPTSKISLGLIALKAINDFLKRTNKVEIIRMLDSVPSVTCHFSALSYVCTQAHTYKTESALYFAGTANRFLG